MSDFIFGTLATDELRREHWRASRAGVTHNHARTPRDPLPGQTITLELTSGPGQPVEQAFVYYTNDGSDPIGALGQASQGSVMPLQYVGDEWDTVLWGYVRRFKVELPGQAEGALLRYRLSAAGGGGEVFADDGAYFACYIADDPTPIWTQRSVVYQIFVDRFFPGEYNSWNQPESLSGFYGGTLRGIGDKLTYLNELGVNALWLTPIHPSPSHHGYDITDYFEVEPRLGSSADLRLLLQGCHAHGLRLMLDFVPNHCSNLHAAFQQAIQDPNSPTRDWFTFKNYPAEYETFFGVKELPQFNLRHPGARKHMLDAAAHWLKFGVDGLRVDYAVGVTPDFWAELRKVAQATQPDAWTFGEIVEPSDSQLRFEGGLDGSLDFILLEGLRQTFAYNRWTGAQFANFLQRHEGYFPETFSRLSFLDNHDMNRFLWAAGGDKRRLKLAALCQFSLSAQPIIYYGTEVGLSQQRDVRQGAFGIPEEARLPMIWDEQAQDKDLFGFYRQLIAQRRKQASLRKGRRRILQAGVDTLVLSGPDEGSVTTVLNLSTEPRRVRLAGEWQNLLVATDPAAELKSDSGDKIVELPPLAGVMIQ